MAQINKFEGQVEIKCNPDKMFDIWARNTLEINKISPCKLSKVELIKGDKCHALGSILCWTYPSPVDGKHEYLKTVLEEIDEKNRSLTFSIIEGNIMSKYYKTWKEKFEIIMPKGGNCSIFKMTLIEFEKKCEDAPHPQLFIDFVMAFVKDIDRHLCSV